MTDESLFMYVNDDIQTNYVWTELFNTVEDNSFWKEKKNFQYVAMFQEIIFLLTLMPTSSKTEQHDLSHL